MLAGIKVGRKRSKKGEDLPLPSSEQSQSVSNNTNAAVADQLRQSLAAGVTHSNQRLLSFGNAARLREIDHRRLVHSDDGDAASKTVVMLHGSNGLFPPVSAKEEGDMTVQELLRLEKSQSKMSLSEQDARMAFRRGKKRLMKASGAIDSDEEEQQQQQQQQQLANGASSHRKIAGVAERDRSRFVAQFDRQNRITSVCWWWISSSSFAHYRLLAYGNHATLVMAPPTRSLLGHGKHLYIVPLDHAPSLTACNESVWEEIRHYQSNLRALCRAEQRGVIFFETVLPSNGFWQTRLEAVIGPGSLCQDAPMYFRSALTEQAEEFGTHQKLMKIDATKNLRASVPKNFSYFYVEYGENGAGYVQMIESNSFPKDFGIDTIAGMMQLDPLRLRSKARVTEDQERQVISQFLRKYENFS